MMTDVQVDALKGRLVDVMETTLPTASSLPSVTRRLLLRVGLLDAKQDSLVALARAYDINVQALMQEVERSCQQ